MVLMEKKARDNNQGTNNPLLFDAINARRTFHTSDHAEDEWKDSPPTFVGTNKTIQLHLVLSKKPLRSWTETWMCSICDVPPCKVPTCNGQSCFHLFVHHQSETLFDPYCAETQGIQVTKSSQGNRSFRHVLWLPQVLVVLDMMMLTQLGVQKGQWWHKIRAVATTMMKTVLSAFQLGEGHVVTLQSRPEGQSGCLS